MTSSTWSSGRRTPATTAVANCSRRCWAEEGLNLIEAWNRVNGVIFKAASSRPTAATSYRKLDVTRRGQLADALTGLLGDGGEDPGATAAISSAIS